MNGWDVFITYEDKELWASHVAHPELLDKYALQKDLELRVFGDDRGIMNERRFIILDEVYEIEFVESI